MRVGFDAKRAFHNFRGLGNYSRTLVESLDKFYPNDQYFLYTPPFKDERSKRWEKQHPKLNVVQPTSVFGKKLSSLWRTFTVSKLAKRDQIDIFHGLSHELPNGIENSGVKSVVTIHDLIFLRFPEFFPWLDRQVYFKKFSHACKVSDRVIAICEQTKRDLIELLNVPEDKIDVVYQSCNPLYFIPTEQREINAVKMKYDLRNDFFLYVGAIEGHKNVDGLIKGFHQASSDIETELVIVGRGKDEYINKLKGLCKELGIESRVRFLIGIPNEDLKPLYAGAQALCLVSFYEGFGIPIIEAMFSGTPSIVTDGSCFPESAGPGGLYVDPRSPESIGKAMCSMSLDKELREKLIKEGSAYVQKFHWEKTSEEMMKVYKKLI